MTDWQTCNDTGWKKYDEAIALYDIACKKYITVFGSIKKSFAALTTNMTHADDTFNELALLQQDNGQYGDAEINFELALSIYNRICGKVHTYNAILFRNIANNYYDMEKFTEAYKASYKSYEIYTAVFGLEYPQFLKAKARCEKIVADQNLHVSCELKNPQSSIQNCFKNCRIGGSSVNITRH